MKRTTSSTLSPTSEKHLAIYATAAFAGATLLTAAQVAQASIISFTYAPQVLAPGAGGTATFQLFTNGPTLKLGRTFESFASVDLTGAVNSHGLSLVTTANYALNLAAGAAISAGRGFTAANSRLIGYAYGMRYNGNYRNQTGYLGFKFNDPTTPSQTDYGWVRIGENSAQTALTITSAGYDNTGKMITAGQTVAAAPEPGTLGLLAGGAGCLAAWRLRKAKRKQAADQAGAMLPS